MQKVLEVDPTNTSAQKIIRNVKPQTAAKTKSSEAVSGK